MSLRSAVRRALTGGLASLPRKPGPGRIVLYHEIRAAADPIMNVSPTLLGAQLEWLREAGLACGSVAQVLDAGFPAGLVGLTLDDGYLSARLGCAAALERGWCATLFVVPAWIDERRPEVLGWDELGELASAGIEIAAHGLAHERLCGPDVAAMTDGLRRARARIEDRLGRPVRGLAYPYGLAGASARAAARAAGYAYACLSEPGSNGARRDPLALRRNEILGTDDRPRLLLGKLGGSDDWMGPLRAFENGRQCP